MYISRSYFSNIFLNCRKNQILSSLLNHDIPVDYLFYNSYISIREIFYHTLIKKKNRLLYKTPLLEDLDIIGLSYKSLVYNNLESHERYLLDRLENQQEVFLWADNKHLFHVTPTEGQHSIMLSSYEYENESFIVSDPPYMPMVKYKNTDIYKACNFAEFKKISYINYENFNIDMDVIKKINVLFKTNVFKIEDDFKEYYYKLISALNDTDMHKHIEETLALIAGSRYFFSLFLLTNNYPNEVFNIFQEISKMAELIKNNLIKQKITKQWDFDKISNDIKQILLLEKRGMSIIKKELDLNKSIIHINPNGNFSNNYNLKLQVLERNGNQIRLGWEEINELFISAYVVSVNQQIYKRTLDNSISLILEPRKSYNINVIVEAVDQKISLVNNHLYIKSINKIDMALHSCAVASSEENKAFTAKNAVDGMGNTRWSSKLNNNEWIYVDFDAVMKIDAVQICWEDAYAKVYKLQVSDDGENWEDIYIENNGEGGREDITGLSAESQFLRLLCLERATDWGYSLWQLKVYGER